MAQKRLTTSADRQAIQKDAELKQEHAEKRADQITDAEVITWARAKMARELGLSLAAPQGK